MGNQVLSPACSQDYGYNEDGRKFTSCQAPTQSHTLFNPIKYSLFKEVPEEKENIDLGTLAQITTGPESRGVLSPQSSWTPV